MRLPDEEAVHALRVQELSTRAAATTALAAREVAAAQQHTVAVAAQRQRRLLHHLQVTRNEAATKLSAQWCVRLWN